MVVGEGPKILAELMQWGASFDMGYNGTLDLGKEGGHSVNRIVHHKDVTGHEIENTLLNHIDQLQNIIFLDHHFAIDLITEHRPYQSKSEDNTCYGAYVLNEETGKVEAIRSGATLLATGGIGQVYGYTTNPLVATGDGIAMAYRAGAKILDMEFVQFHPTALYDTNDGPSFLISEAVRGFGGYLRNMSGERFMLHYDERAELASRDILSKSIENELKKTGDGYVYLDCTHLDMEKFRAHFPNIYEKCRSLKIDLAKDWVPVIPMAHYLCGGIVVDRSGKTSVNNLFACGECSRTGMHGANRLASNSLLEALVYAHKIQEYLFTHPTATAHLPIPDWKGHEIDNNSCTIEIDRIVEKLQSLMRNYAGIVRSDAGLERAMDQLNIITMEVEAHYKKSKLNTSFFELGNMVDIAQLIIGQSIKRKENKGGYYNEDRHAERVERADFY
jgi:L-aspartate oxidase